MNLPTCISSNRKIRYTVCFVILITLSVLFLSSVYVPEVCRFRSQISGDSSEGNRMNFMQPFSFRSVSREHLRQSCSAVRWRCPGICCRLFSQSDRRTVCPWYFFRGKIICGGRDDRVLKIFQNTIFCGSDRGGVRRIYAVDVLRASDVTESSEYVIFSADRSDDRLYLFCSHRFSCDICRGF